MKALSSKMDCGILLVALTSASKNNASDILYE
jgi:hypothetical protein